MVDKTHVTTCDDESFEHGSPKPTFTKILLVVVT